MAIFLQNHLNLNKQNLRLLLLVGGVVLVLILILLYSILSPQLTTKKNPVSKLDPTKTTKIVVNRKEVEVAPRVEQIKPELLKSLIDQKEALVIVQIMSATEWQKGHLAGSEFIPLSTILNYAPNLDKNSKTVLISKDGVDGATAAEKMIYGWGFYRQITFNLEGGLNAWQKKGYKVEK